MNDKRINWPICLGLLGITFFAITGVIWCILEDAIYLKTVVWAIVLFFCTGMSITAGYHRLFSHRAYRASWPVKLFFLIFGTMAAEGSVLEWCTDHRKHHLYTDTDKDPYSAKKGFFYAHMGWLFMIEQHRRDYENVEDLEADPMILFQHKHYLKLLVIFNILMSVGVSALWGDLMGGLFIAGFARLMANHHSTFLVNSWAHFFGKQPYSSRCSAKDSILVGLLAHGEGYHNFHHQFANDYRNAIRWYQYDPTKWLIFLLSKIRLTSDLKRISPRVIMAYKMKRSVELALEKRPTLASLDKSIEDLIKPFKEKLNGYYDQIELLREECHTIRTSKIKLVKELKQTKLKLLKAKQKQLHRDIDILLTELQFTIIQYS